VCTVDPIPGSGEAHVKQTEILERQCISAPSEWESGHPERGFCAGTFGSGSLEHHALAGDTLMNTLSARLAIWIRAITDHMRAAGLLLGGLGVLLFSTPSSAQAPAGTASATPDSQGTALIQWNFGPIGGAPTSKIQISHCTAGFDACTAVGASPDLFQSTLPTIDCDNVPNCPSSVDDTQLAASTTYVDMVTVFPPESDTTSQITSVLTNAYTTPAFPAPSITSVQAMSGSSVLLTAFDPTNYYEGMNVYACPGAGCSNFSFLTNFVSGFFNSTTQAFIPISDTGPLVGLTPSTTYSFYVTFFDGQNTSPASPTFTFETPTADTTPPTTPTNLTAQVISTTQINLSYGASTDNLYLAYYSVQRCTGGACTNVYSGSALTFNDTGLTPSTTYQYTVFAVDGSGNKSPASNVVTATTLPGTPMALTASNVTSTQATLSWTPAGTTPLDGFLIEQCQGVGCTTFTQIAQVSSPVYQVTGLVGLATYQFRVRSADPAGDDSEYSNIVTVNTLPIAGPTALTAGTPTNSQITLTWTASTAPGVSAYLIERCLGAGCTNFVQIGSALNSPYMDGGLLPQSVYQYRVRAQDSGGGLSDYVTAGATTTTLSAPTGLSGSAVSNSQIDLSWIGVSSAGVASYLIERCSGAGCTSFSQIAAVSGTSYSDTGLTPGTTYGYRVRATDPAAALSAYAPSAFVTTLVLSAPTGLTAAALSSSQVSLGWSASTTTPATGYIVQRCNGEGCNGFAPVANVTTLSYTDTGLSASTAYSYRVQATDASGDVSPDSNVASATTSSGAGSGSSGGGSGSGGSSGGGSGTGSSLSTYGYDSNGHLLTITTNGVTTTYTYDAAGHVVGIQNGP